MDLGIAGRKALVCGASAGLGFACAKALAAEGVAVRVVSMPSTDVFERQDAEYKASVLPKGLPRVAVEAGVTDFWFKYVGLDGKVIGIDTFGASAPIDVLYDHFGLTAEKIVPQILSRVS